MRLGARWYAVHDVDEHVQSFRPPLLVYASVMKHGTSHLHQCPVRPLGHAALLRRVRHFRSTKDVMLLAERL